MSRRSGDIQPSQSVRPTETMSSAATFSLQNTCSAPLNVTTNCKLRGIFKHFLHRGSVTHSLLAAGVSSACLCRACSSTAGETPISEEQRFRWAERLFWDLNFLPQMGQSGTPGGGGGGGGGAGALSSLSSKHLQKGNILNPSTSLMIVVQMFIYVYFAVTNPLGASVEGLQSKYSKSTHLLTCCVRPSGLMCVRSLWQI